MGKLVLAQQGLGLGVYGFFIAAALLEEAVSDVTTIANAHQKHRGFQVDPAWGLNGEGRPRNDVTRTERYGKGK